MQTAAVKFTKNDLAKYPFLKETTEYVKRLDLKIEDLTNPEFAKVLERAEERVEKAIQKMQERFTSGTQASLKGFIK